MKNEAVYAAVIEQAREHRIAAQDVNGPLCVLSYQPIPDNAATRDSIPWR